MLCICLYDFVIIFMDRRKVYERIKIVRYYLIYIVLVVYIYQCFMSYVIFKIYYFMIIDVEMMLIF